MRTARRLALITLTAAGLAGAGLSACATDPYPTPNPPPLPGPPMTDNGNDCAVIAAVAREHYRFGPDNVPPPLWLDGEGSNWSPRCDWSRYGVSFPRVYNPDRTPAPGERVQWVSFKRPRYDNQGAVVESGILHGPLAGMGVECRVRSGFAGWTATECRNTWIS